MRIKRYTLGKRAYWRVAVDAGELALCDDDGNFFRLFYGTGLGFLGSMDPSAPVDENDIRPTLPAAWVPPGYRRARDRALIVASDALLERIRTGQSTEDFEVLFTEDIEGLDVPL